MEHKRKILQLIGLICFSSFLLVSCSVPKHMDVRHGVDPKEQDEDVRFRTTYYFRVFDYCEVNNAVEGRENERISGDHVFPRPRGALNPVSDSLYRFRMTGKANSLFNTINFESGTLSAEEIDPFGANIEFDSKRGRFFFQSRGDRQRQSHRSELLRQIGELKTLRKSLDEKKEKSIYDQLNAQISALINALGGTAPVPLVADYHRAAESGLSAARAALKEFKSNCDGAKAKITAGATCSTVIAAIDSSTPKRNVTQELENFVKRRNALSGFMETAEKDLSDVYEFQLSEARSQLEQVEKNISNHEKLIRDKEADILADLRQTGDNREYDNEPGQCVDGTRPLTALHNKGKPEIKTELEGLNAEWCRLDGKRRTAEVEQKNKEINLSSAREKLDVVKSQLNVVNQNLWALRTGRANRDLSPNNSNLRPANSTSICENGVPTKRDFQVFGPQGVIPFDQDDRLIMAMSSSARPLIGTLQQWSSRVLNAQPNQAESLLPLVRELVRVVEAEKVIAGAIRSDTSASAEIKNAIEMLKPVEQISPQPADNNTVTQQSISAGDSR